MGPTEAAGLLRRDTLIYDRSLWSARPDRTASAGCQPVNGDITTRAMPLPIFRDFSFSFPRLLLALVLAALIAGCGGGSDSHPLMWQGSPPVGLLKDPPEGSGDPVPQTHRISTSAGEGGSINPATTTAVEGEASLLTILTEPGYSIATVEGCGGVIVAGNRYRTAPVTAPCTITASFTLDSRTVATFVRSAFGGSTTGDGEFLYGSEVTVTAVPDPGFVFVAWTEGSVLVSTEAEYTFELLANRSLSANFAVAATSTRVGMPPVGRVRLFEAGNAPSGVLFASTIEVAAGDGGIGIWRSADGGASWSRTADVEARFISIASADPSLVIAGHTGGYLISQDGGLSWSAGVIGAPGGASVAPEAAAAVNAEAIYMAVAAIAAPGLYRSLDLGASWERIRGPEPFLPITHIQLRHVAVSADDPAVIHALTIGNLNVWRSVDGGASFFSIRTGIAFDQPQVFDPGLRVDPQDADRILIENHITLNGGANWTPLVLPPRMVEMFDSLGNGPFEVVIAQDRVSPRNTVWLDGDLLRVEGNRLVVSQDQGASWSDLLTLVGSVGNFDTERLFLTEDALYLQLIGGPDMVQRVDLQLIRDALAE